MRLSGGRVLAMFAVMVALLSTCDLALAVTLDDSALAKGLSLLVDMLTGKVARMMAVLAIIGMGIMALTGRVEWSRAIVVVLGIGIIFSAATLIEVLFPPANTTNSSTVTTK